MFDQMELHDVEQWRSTIAMAPPAQSALLELLEQVTALARERNELRRTLADVREMLDQARTPWVSIRSLLNELQRMVE